MRIRLFWIKFFNWEYWPFSIVYIPIFFYWLWHALKARSLFYFSASNPSIETGGMSGESKYEILKKIPEEFIPTTIFIQCPADIELVKKEIKNKNISFPLIAKPDVGERGIWVEKISDESELENYCKKIKVNFLIQEFINFEVELGVFYLRHPDWEKGMVSSVVMKDFLKVKGDGITTIFELMSRYPRAAFQLKRLGEKNRQLMKYIPELNEVVELEPIGNHSRGTTFLDANYLIDKGLNSVFDNLSKKIEGFYFGRFDLKCTSIEDLMKGKNIKILELNGAGAEPGHIYQPGYSIINGYRDLFFHWKHMYEISIKNKTKGHPYMTFKEGWKKIQWIRAYNKKLN